MLDKLTWIEGSPLPALEPEKFSREEVSKPIIVQLVDGSYEVIGTLNMSLGVCSCCYAYLDLETDIARYAVIDLP